MSACKALMQPIGLTVKPSRNKYRENTTGELMLIHRCDDCGKLSINRIAADDQVEKLIEIFRLSCALDSAILVQLAASDIRILQLDDWTLVSSQLRGIPGI